MSEDTGFCRKCGTKIKEEDVFCSKCGTKLDTTKEEIITEVFKAQEETNKWSLGKRIIVGIGCLLVIFFGLVVLVAMLPHSNTSTSSSMPPTLNSIVSTPAQDDNVCKWFWSWKKVSHIGDIYAPAGECYVIIDLDICNNAEQSVSTNPFFWSFTANGLKYTADSATFSSEIDHQSVDVGQGGGLETQIVYLVKGNPSDAYLTYTGFNAPEMVRI